jgi:glycosyltransferase involved in cell wall biosynthesis
MSVYNGEKYLREAVDSILNQTFRDFEFIIVDDGSTDRTWVALQSYDDPRIVLLRNEENIGLTRSLNKGLAVARGEYIARMDADDISLPERFEKQVKALDENPCLGLVGSNTYLFNAAGRRKTKKYPQTDLEIKWYLLFSNGFSHPAVMFRHHLVKEIGFYDETLTSAQDYEFFSRIAEHCEVGNLPQPLVVRRYREGRISVVQSERQRATAAMVSRRNIQRLLSLHGEYHSRLVFENLPALWSTQHPPLIEQSPEQVMTCVKRLLSIFCRQYQPTMHPRSGLRHTLIALRRHTLARLYFHTAARYYRRGEMATTWIYFLKSLFYQPTAAKWPVFGRLVLRTLVGRRVFEVLKRQMAIRNKAQILE